MNNKGQTMWMWIIGIIIILLIIGGGYFVYAKYRENKNLLLRQETLRSNIQELNKVISEKDVLIEQIQGDIRVKEKEKQIIDARYRKLKAQLIEKVKEGEAIKKPEGENEISAGFNKHGYNPIVRK